MLSNRALCGLLAGILFIALTTNPVTAAGFRALILDLIWVFTTPKLRQDRDTWAVVDGVAFERFRPIDPYNLHEQGPCFTARPPKQREAVVSAIAQVLFGSRSAEVFGIRDRRMCENLELHPFVEILRATNRNRARLFDHARHWPVSLRDRLREAQLRLSGPDPKCSLTFAKSQPTGLTGSLSCSKPLARRPAQSGR